MMRVVFVCVYQTTCCGVKATKPYVQVKIDSKATVDVETGVRRWTFLGKHLFIVRETVFQR